MRVFLLLWVAGVLYGAGDAREIVRRSVEADRAAQNLARSYTFVERLDYREKDGSGQVKRREIKTFDVTLADGTPYRRLIERDDKPLSPAAQQQEEERLRKSIADRRSEKPEQRARRIREWEAKRRKQREFAREVVNAFDFKLLGEEQVDGHDTYIIEATPRPGYRPGSAAARFLTKTVARLWINKADYAWVKVDAEMTDTVSFGVFLARVYKGTRLHLEQTRVNNEIWLPRRIQVSSTGRIALIKRFGGEWDYTYRDYRKFQADSRVVSFGDPAATPR
ncbi:MAG: hypothetical protein M1436_07250 [Acidobacteria bacterium]|nr:hypothetical protein [Acidobacteriota bacterium]